MHIHFTEKNEFKTVLFLVTCRFCKRMCRTSSYLFGRNVNASLYWGYDTPKGSSQLPPAPYYYYYFWTDLRLGEPHIDSKTARGIILAIDFENSPLQLFVVLQNNMGQNHIPMKITTNYL